MQKCFIAGAEHFALCWCARATLPYHKHTHHTPRKQIGLIMPKFQQRFSLVFFNASFGKIAIDAARRTCLTANRTRGTLWSIEMRVFAPHVSMGIWLWMGGPPIWLAMWEIAKDGYSFAIYSSMSMGIGGWSSAMCRDGCEFCWRSTTMYDIDRSGVRTEKTKSIECRTKYQYIIYIFTSKT